MIPLTLATLAFALPCADPFTADEFGALVSTAETALDNDDVMGHGQTWVRIKESMPCMVDPLSRDKWARYLIGYAIIRHATGEEWRASLLTALRIDPHIDRDYGHDDIRLFPVPPPEELRGLPLAQNETFLLDGLVMHTAPPHLEGPHVIQMAGSPYKTRLVIDQAFPSDWLAADYREEAEPQPAAPDPVTSAPEPVALEPQRGSKPLLFTGLALGAAGTAAVAVTFFKGTGNSTDFENPQQFEGLVIANAVSWGVVGVGTGLVSIHVVKSLRVDVGPGHVGIRGRL